MYSCIHKSEQKEVNIISSSVWKSMTILVLTRSQSLQAFSNDYQTGESSDKAILACAFACIGKRTLRKSA